MHNSSTKAMIWVGAIAASYGVYVIAGIWAAIAMGVFALWQLNR